MKKSSLAAFAFALLAAAAPFAALLVPPAAPTPLTDFVQADDLSPAATPQPLPTMPPSNAQNGTTVPDAALAAADITLYDADTGTNRVVSVRDFLIGAAACEMPPTWNDDTLLAQMVASHSYALALGAPMQVNSALCAGWTDTEVLEARWGDDFTAYYSRFAALADEAAGALLCDGGAPAAACYHSISNGVTEASHSSGRSRPKRPASLCQWSIPIPPLYVRRTRIGSTFSGTPNSGTNGFSVTVRSPLLQLSETSSVV